MNKRAVIIRTDVLVAAPVEVAGKIECGPDLDERRGSMEAKPQKQHEWLKRFVGQWEYECECPGEAGQPGAKFRGSETIRMLGDLWMVSEGKGEMPGGGTALTMMTLGYDPQKERFVGTWIGTMMAVLWVYEGTLDGNKLPLNAHGPDCAEPGKVRRYQDIYEFTSENERTLTSRMQQDDGTWKQFMTALYRRKR
jgi:hypothetical protein